MTGNPEGHDFLAWERERKEYIDQLRAMTPKELTALDTTTLDCWQMDCWTQTMAENASGVVMAHDSNNAMHHPV